ncbi:Lrp/AsnC family transcriptional regulator [Halalkalicoccus ordinarius]|uniref:Lrp/AsnC family transcriptional regulator n=1 Tax=Halalkalicoccus ordinarius TaxID=3116651 RepID=UPI00300F2E2C
MDPYQLDDVDERLLSLLQENGRYTATDLAERIGVSDNTVHNRMRRLEEAGVITGYTATIDHKRTELSLYFLFTCTVRISRRSEMANEALAIPRVLEVTELMTGERNLLIKVVGAKDVEISRTAERLDELGIEVNDEDLIRAEHAVSLDYVRLRGLDSEE